MTNANALYNTIMMLCVCVRERESAETNTNANYLHNIQMILYVAQK